ncbi:MAG: DUF1583 domain-containing protein [Isosphaeraceae bacterium]|nr:DUF1583 domain-containing protein [Isosphaeraceae bacterium]
MFGLQHQWMSGVLASALIAVASALPASAAQIPPDRPEPPDAPATSKDEQETEERDRVAAERFLAVLERNPRRGTALDRVYGREVELGTLDARIAKWRERTQRDPGDAAAWMLIGLFEAQRGKDGEAVEAFRAAAKAKPTDPLASYYLGQSLVLVARPEEAVEAFERALTLRPARTDLLEIHQALGRVHQRAGRTEKALEVWTRLEKLFPDDLRVQEQIAVALAEEGRPDDALVRFTRLAERTTDAYRKIQFELEAAGLLAGLGRASDALSAFESVLDRLEPESWQARDVRRKIEEVFTRKDDLAGLASYYEKRLTRVPDDLEAMARLGRTLGLIGRAADARAWFEKALKLAPGNKTLRAALIENLKSRGEIAAAASQYEELHRVDPADRDVLRDWGRLLLADASKPEADRRRAAAAVWKRLAPDDSTDPVAVAQAADLFRQAGFETETLDLYRRAVALAPQSPQYREYLGEYLHTLKRPAEAIAAWSEIAAGEAENAATLARLGEVLAGFGYRDEALPHLTKALSLDPGDLDLRLSRIDVLILIGRLEEADAELALAEKRPEAAPSDAAEAVLTRRIKVYQARDRLVAEIDALRKRLTDAGRPDAAGWTRLSRLLEADGRVAPAAEAAARAAADDPKSIDAWVALARLRETSGDLLAAVEASTKLLALDRRARTDHLTNIARLEARLGRKDRALQAGRDLLAAAPGNLEHAKFYAELCFQLDAADQGLDALRRGVRSNPSDPAAMIDLAEQLGKLFRVDEAIELYWRAFDKTTDLDARLAIVARLTEQYAQKNDVDALVARIDRIHRGADQVRERSLCLAQIHQSSGDPVSARRELERLAAVTPRDPLLLRRLADLADSTGDSEAAAAFFARLVQVAPAAEVRSKWALSLLRAGKLDDAAAVWSGSVDEEKDPARVLAAVDSLIASGKAELAARVIDRRLQAEPTNWEMLTRRLVAAVDRRDLPAADAAAREILALQLDDDAPAIAAKAGPRAVGSINASQPGPQLRLIAANTARMIAGMDQRMNGPGSVARGWTPADHGQARVVAIAWLLAREPGKPGEVSFLDRLRQDSDKRPEAIRPLWDLHHSAVIRRDDEQQRKILERLAQASPGDPAVAFLQLMQMSTRFRTIRPSYYGSLDQLAEAQAPPSTEELERLARAILAVLQKRPNWGVEAYAGPLLPSMRTPRSAELYDRIAEALLAGPVDSARASRLASAFADCKDAASLEKLVARFQTDRSPTASNAGFNPYYSVEATIIGRFLGVLAETSGPDAAFSAYDEIRLRRRDRRKLELRAIRSSTATNMTANRSWNMTVWTSSSRPSSGMSEIMLELDSFTPTDIQILFNVREIAREKQRGDDAIARFGPTAPARDAAERLENAVITAYLLWWRGDREAAVDSLDRARSLAPKDAGLALGLASLRERLGYHREALEVLDSVETFDQVLMRRRETDALRIAAALGDTDRARVAAERLFGLRLDGRSQLDLAGKMSSLGLHDLSDAVLNRAQGSVGNRLAELVELMNRFQTEGRVEQAVEAAYKILDQTKPAGRTTSNPTAGIARIVSSYAVAGGGIAYYSSAPSPASRSNASERRAALTVLARAGEIRRQIDRLEARLASNPKDEAAILALIELYTTENRKDQIDRLQSALRGLEPANPRARLEASIGRLATGTDQSAAKEIEAALVADPALLVDFGNPLLNAFSSKGKLPEYATIVSKLDLDRVPQSWPLSQPAQMLLSRPETREAGLALYSKILEKFPTDRWSNIYVLLNNEYARKSVDVYRTAVELISNTGMNPASPWTWLDTTIGGRANGRSLTYAGALVDSAIACGRVDDLRERMTRIGQSQPRWNGGEVILAMLDLRIGKIEAALARIDALAKRPNGNMPASVRGMLADELRDAGVDTRADLMLDAIAADTIALIKERRFNGNSVAMTAQILVARGRTDDLVRVLEAAEKAEPLDDGSPQTSALMFTQVILLPVAQQYLAVGRRAREFETYMRGYRLIRDAWAGSELDASTQQWLITLLQSAEAALRAASGPDFEAAWRSCIDHVGRGDLDLQIVVESPRLSDARLSSRLLQEIEAAAKRSPENRSKIRKLIADAAQARPDSLALRILRIELSEGPEETARLIDELKEHLKKRPAVDRSSRTGAAEELALWLAARRGLEIPAATAISRSLAEQALDASGRLPSPAWRDAIRREWGDIELKSGDKARGERLWTDLLESLRPRPNPRPGPREPDAKRGAGRANPFRPTVRFVKQQPRPIPAIADPARLPANASTAAERFERMLEIAAMAADRGLVELSLEAFTDAYAAGPPILASTSATALPLQPTYGSYAAIPMQPLMPAFPASRISVSEGQPAAPGPVRVTNLVAAWKAQGMSPRRIYDVLLAASLPASRPGEVFLLDEAGAASRSGTATERILVRAALDAGTVDDLRRQLSERTLKGAAELNALALLGDIARASGNADALNTLLGRLETRLKTDSLQNTLEMTVDLARPALRNEATSDRAAALIRLCIPRFQRAPARIQITDLGIELARYEFKAKRPAEALARLEESLDAVERIARRTGENGAVAARNRKSRIEAAASLLIDEGRPFEALTILGRAADAVESDDMIINARVLFRLAHRLALLPPAERFAKLREWSLPTPKRRSVRALAAVGRFPMPPAEFAASAAKLGFALELPGGGLPSTVSTSRLLVAWAKEAGELEALCKELKTFADDHVENAEAVYLSAEIEQGRIGEVAERFRSYVAARRATQNDTDRTILGRLVELEPAFLALGVESVHPAAMELLETRRPRLTNSELANELSSAIEDRRVARELPAAPARPDLAPEHWFVEPGRVARVAAAEGVIHRPRGPGNDQVMFRYPLRGSFRVEAELLHESGTTSILAFGPVEIDPLGDPPGMGGREAPVPFHVGGPEEFHRLTIDVTPQGQTVRLEDHLFRKSNVPTDVDPWLRWVVRGSGRAAIRNVRVVGEPTIPRELDLLPMLRLRARPATSAMSAALSTVPASRRPAVVNPPPAGPAPGWVIVDDELRGDRKRATIPARVTLRESWIDGERVGFEWFHAPGSIEAFAAIGDLGVVPTSEGIRLVHLASSADLIPLSAAEAISPREPSGPIALRENDWNRFDATIEAGGRVTIRINDREVWKMVLAPDARRGFAVAFDPCKSDARIRRPRLEIRGPDHLSSALAANLSATPANRPALSAAAADLRIPEKYRSESYEGLFDRIESATPAARFDALAAHVLPTADHRSWRIEGGFAPGGTLRSPAWELVEAARQAGKLDDLLERTKEAAGEGEPSKSARLAIRAMASAARGDDAELGRVLDALAATSAPASVSLNWARFLASRAAASREGMREKAGKLLDQLLTLSLSDGPGWDALTINAARFAATIGRSEAAPQRFRYFEFISGETAWTESRGIPRSGWRVEGDGFRKLPGAPGNLTHVVPLMGDFDAEAVLEGGSLLRETRLVYGGVWLPGSKNATYRYKIERRGRRLTAFVDGEKVGEHTFDRLPAPWLSLSGPELSSGRVSRLSIRGIGAPAKNWAVFESDPASIWTDFHTHPAPRGLQAIWSVVGRELSSTIARKDRPFVDRGEGFTTIRPAVSTAMIRLMPATTSPFMMGEPNPSTEPEPTLPITTMEGLYRLNMPFSEGMTIRYGSLYEPGRHQAHPVLGNTAYLLEESGLAFHPITNGPFGRPSLDPAARAAADGPVGRPGGLALSPGIHHQVEITRKNGRLRMTLNGKEILDRAVVAGEDLRFGIFQFADKGTARVRDLMVELEPIAPEKMPSPEQLLERDPGANAQAIP